MSEICDQIRACVRSARARVKCKIDKINWLLKISETHASKQRTIVGLLNEPERAQANYVD